MLVQLFLINWIGVKRFIMAKGHCSWHLSAHSKVLWVSGTVADWIHIEPFAGSIEKCQLCLIRPDTSFDVISNNGQTLESLAEYLGKQIKYAYYITWCLKQIAKHKHCRLESQSSCFRDWPLLLMPSVSSKIVSGRVIHNSCFSVYLICHD